MSLSQNVAFGVFTPSYSCLYKYMNSNNIEKTTKLILPLTSVANDNQYGASDLVAVECSFI